MTQACEWSEIPDEAPLEITEADLEPDPRYVLVGFFLCLASGAFTVWTLWVAIEWMVS